jgi:hypothetical protein
LETDSQQACTQKVMLLAKCFFIVPAPCFMALAQKKRIRQRYQMLSGEFLSAAAKAATQYVEALRAKNLSP